MCGRYSITMPPEAMRDLFRFEGLPNLPPRYNVAPTQDVPVVRPGEGAGRARELAMLRWGLVPSWSKGTADEILSKSPLINARGESVAQKPSFRSAFARRRCLLPADGFYEWRAMGKGPKQPYHIHRADGRPIAFAGIWDSWSAPDGSDLESVAIVTTNANEALKIIHPRMPVILDEDDFEAWLDTEATEPDAATTFLKPAPDDLLVADPVSRDVNKVSNNDPSLIEPVEIDTPAPKKAAAKTAKKKTGGGQLDLL